MNWTVFDSATAEALRGMPVDASGIQFTNGDPLDAALRNKQDSLLLLPGDSANEVKLLYFRRQIISQPYPGV